MAQSDEAALVALSLEYADAVRARDAERWAATWTEDARWVLEEGRDVVGRDAIVALWTTSIAKYARGGPAVPGLHVRRRRRHGHRAL